MFPQSIQSSKGPHPASGAVDTDCPSTPTRGIRQGGRGSRAWATALSDRSALRVINGPGGAAASAPGPANLPGRDSLGARQRNLASLARPPGEQWRPGATELCGAGPDSERVPKGGGGQSWAGADTPLQCWVGVDLVPSCAQPWSSQSRWTSQGVPSSCWNRQNAQGTCDKVSHWRIFNEGTPNQNPAWWANPRFAICFPGSWGWTLWASCLRKGLKSAAPLLGQLVLHSSQESWGNQRTFWLQLLGGVPRPLKWKAAICFCR